jgi:hypothetical protein
MRDDQKRRVNANDDDARSHRASGHPDRGERK